MERSEIIEFVRGMKPKDHVIMFYSKPEDKREVLFTYLKAGLGDGEAAAYIAGQESPEAISQGMKSYGVDVDVFERSGALRIINYSDWYAIDGAFGIIKTSNSWKKLFYKSIIK
jgi:KaiC/GvpD/RAD55 family RecA-like ATPase